MRFILALVSLVIAVVLIGLGVAQRTVFAGDDRIVAATNSASENAVTVLDGTTLNALPGLQDVRIGGPGPIFAAYAPTTDVLAWIGDTTFTSLGFDATTATLTSRVVTGADATVPSPAGSDLWLREYSGTDELRMPVKLDADLSILIVSDGTAPAPSEISVTWPVDNRTPWAGPLIVAGVAMLALALVFFCWALIHQRRTRGPRRKSIKPPRTPRLPRLPRQRSYRVRKPAVAVSGSRGRRAIRPFIALPALALSTALLSGCSAGFWPGSSAAPVPSVSPSTAAEEVAPTVAAASVDQVRDILQSVSEVAAAADASLDATALTSRFDGPALAYRTGVYGIRAKDSAAPAPAAIPTDLISVSLPQVAGDTWPRSLFAVVQATDATIAPVALTLVQQTARDPYKVMYAVDLAAGTELPALAPKGVGALPLGPDSTVLSTPPGVIPAAYADVLASGEASASYGLFDLSRDTLYPQIISARDKLKADLAANGVAESTYAAGTGPIIALSSNESGALVSVEVTETTTVKPAEQGATLNTQGSIKTLSGISGTTKGLVAVYADQLLMYIPPLGSTDAITLLGSTQGLISTKELP